MASQARYIHWQHQGWVKTWEGFHSLIMSFLPGYNSVHMRPHICLAKVQPYWVCSVGTYMLVCPKLNPKLCISAKASKAKAMQLCSCHLGLQTGIGFTPKWSDLQNCSWCYDRHSALLTMGPLLTIIRRETGFRDVNREWHSRLPAPWLPNNMQIYTHKPVLGFLYEPLTWEETVKSQVFFKRQMLVCLGFIIHLSAS